MPALQQHESPLPRPLAGVRVLEAGPWISACYAGKLLADLGADVVRLESPDGDDLARRFGPFPGDVPDRETGAVHLYYNANKRSVTLRGETATGARLFAALASWADVLLDGTDPGHFEGLGLGHASLEQANPRLITVSVTSLGSSGPYGAYRGSDLISWHGSGAGHVYMGEPDRAPLYGTWNLASHWGGSNAACAAMIALRARDITGRGQFVDIAEAEALAQLYLSVEVSDFMQSGAARVRAGFAGQQGQAPSAMFRAKDGWVYVMAMAPQQWEGLVQAMGSPEWAQSPIFKGTSRDRARYADEIYAMMQPWLDEHTTQEIFEVCQAHGVPAAPVQTAAGLWGNEHLAARGFWAEQSHPRAGKVRMPGAPYRISGEAWRLDRPAPLLGQHNDELYCGALGLAKAELVALRRGDVI